MHMTGKGGEGEQRKWYPSWQGKCHQCTDWRHRSAKNSVEKSLLLLWAAKTLNQGSYEPKQKVEGKGQRDGKGSSKGGQGDQDGAKMARVGRDGVRGVTGGKHWRT